MSRIALFAALFLFASPLFGQTTEFELTVATSTELDAPYTTTIHSGARAIAGPLDGDGDGKMEVYLSDYTNGGRVHVIENVGVNLWEHVYSTPFLDSTATTENIRSIAVGDLDGDSSGEIFFLSGRGFSATNPNIASLPPGLYAFENVGDNDWGTAPVSIYEFNNDLPDRWRTEAMSVADVDGDGAEELMISNNGGNNRYDNWYVMSVSGDFGFGFEVWTEELRLSSRSAEDFDPVGRGGGSPYAMHAANLDGLGGMELALHSWNAFNLTVAAATGQDSYNVSGAFLNASTTGDDVSFFGGTVIDINGDGDDEVYFPVLCWSGGSPRPVCGGAALLNFEAGEDPLAMTADNVTFRIIEDISELGITSGDLDGDGRMEIIGGGPSFTGEAYDNGDNPVWIRIAEFQGGDVEDPANYTIDRIEFPADRIETKFSRVEVDDNGTMSTIHEDGPQGPEFVSKLAYLGDPDNDGINEVAIAFQGVDDSTFVISRTRDPVTNLFISDTTSSAANAGRVFMKVVSGDGLGVNIEDERIIVPSDYRLFAAYPNPFNPSTSIGFELPIDKRVSLNIYDVTGRMVRSLVSGVQLAAGRHEVTWDGTNDAGELVASGTYLYALEYGNFRQSRRLSFVK